MTRSHAAASCLSVRLDGSLQKLALACSCILFAAVYLNFCAKHFLASYFATDPNIQSLLRASSLEPQNAEYQDMLGRYYQWVAGEPNVAIIHYERAVNLNPHIARYWFDLSNQYHLQGNKSGQVHALENAVAADPTTPDVAWEGANLAWTQGDVKKALQEFRVVLASDSSLAPPALERCWRLKPDVDALLRDALPAKADVYSAFLVFLTAKTETEAANKVWSRIVELQQPIAQEHVFDYVSFLLAQHKPEEAQRVWSQAATLSELEPYQPSPENLVINSDFSLPILNAGFDWRYEEKPGVTISLDAAETRSGRATLAFTFDSSGIDDIGIRQVIAVEADRKYEFSAYSKSEDLQGAGGPKLSLQDYYDGTSYFQSDELKDAGLWKLVTGSFTTLSDTKVLLLSLRRVPAGSAIRGKLWIDGIRLTEVEPVASVQ